MLTHATFEHEEREREIRETIRFKNFLRLLISISRVVELITNFYLSFSFFSLLPPNSKLEFQSYPRQFE